MKEISSNKKFEKEMFGDGSSNTFKILWRLKFSCWISALKSSRATIHTKAELKTRWG